MQLEKGVTRVTSLMSYTKDAPPPVRYQFTVTDVRAAR